jgi:hypothetical protein
MNQIHDRPFPSRKNQVRARSCRQIGAPVAFGAFGDVQEVALLILAREPDTAQLLHRVFRPVECLRALPYAEVVERGYGAKAFLTAAASRQLARAEVTRL